MYKLYRFEACVLKAMDVKVVGVISSVFPYLMVRQKGYAF